MKNETREDMAETLEAVARGLRGGSISKCYVVWYNQEDELYGEGYGLKLEELAAALEIAKLMEMQAYVQALRDMF